MQKLNRIANVVQVELNKINHVRKIVVICNKKIAPQTGAILAILKGLGVFDIH